MKRQQGFTILEVLVATTVLAVGMMSVAAALARMLATSSRARYMSMAAELASEKLEDLNRWPAAAPAVAVTTGSSAGSLTQDLPSYYDEVGISNPDGALVEWVSGTDDSGATTYTVSSFHSNGTVTTTTSSTPPVGMTYLRRWQIEKDVPTPGLRRVTIQVELEDKSVQPPVTFQMSAVRP
jgi:prepilin-type N-terminal cleavage/methylation domain-containing protein